MSEEEEMRWRIPERELPVEGQVVWVMLTPHKHRGTLLESAMSVEIVCGEVYCPDLSSVIVENNDELGLGGITFCLKCEDHCSHISYSQIGIAWMPVGDLPLPDWDEE